MLPTMNYMPLPVPRLVKERPLLAILKISTCSSPGILPFYSSMVDNCGILCLCLQDTKNPDLMVPIPEIREPLPPEKSNCPETTSAPVPGDNAGNESLPPGTFPLFFGMTCAVIGILNQ